MATAKAPTCSPAASRATRIIVPAVTPSFWPALSETNTPSAMPTSLIERTSLIGCKLPRLGKSFLQLSAQLKHGIGIRQPTFDLDSQPQ